MQPIQTIATVTSKGQITLPKSVRQALGADTGSKLAFTLSNGSVLVSRVDEDHTDPAVADFLNLLERDIRQSQHVGNLSNELLAALRAHSAVCDEDSEEIEGEVCL